MTKELGLGNISILSQYCDTYSVQYQYRQHFLLCNITACAILSQKIIMYCGIVLQEYNV